MTFELLQIVGYFTYVFHDLNLNISRVYILQKINTREAEIRQKLDIIKLREQHLDKKAQELALAEIELAERKLLITMLQQGGQVIGPRPTPEKRKGKFKRKALRKEHLISEPSGN